MQYPGFRIQPHQEFKVDAKTVEPVGRTPGISNHTVGRISTKTCPEIQQLVRRYNRGVRKREFGAGDLVLRMVVGNTRDINIGKLALTWDGPFRVTAIVGAKSYYLEDLDERPLPRPWNAHNLKKFYGSGTY